MAEKNDYFDYITDVLGIRSVLLEKNAATAECIPLLISVEDYESYTEAEKDLLAKMIGALKMDPKLIRVADAAQISPFSPEFTVYFGEVSESGPARGLATFSPRYLLRNPEAKKTAWNDLQKAILFFKNPRP